MRVFLSVLLLMVVVKYASGLTAYFVPVTECFTTKGDKTYGRVVSVECTEVSQATPRYYPR